MSFRLSICIGVGAALGVSAMPALACNSGDLDNDNRISGSNCRGTAAAAATAVGQAASADVDGTALGNLADAGGGAVAIGTLATATGDRSTAVGYFASTGQTSVEGATVVGALAGIRGAGVYSTAIGASFDGNQGAAAAGDFSVAIGGGNGTMGSYGFKANGASATSIWGTAVGAAAIASAQSATALGAGSTASALETTAVGLLAKASVVHATAIGHAATATGDAATATGNASKAAGVGASAYGTGSAANSDSSSAFGRDSSAAGNEGTAIGGSSEASGKASVAAGFNTVASATGALALGVNARATRAGAVALGYGSVGNVAYAVSVGSARREKRIINVAKGINATDAVNLGQVQAMLAQSVAPAVAAATSAPSLVVTGAPNGASRRKLAIATTGPDPQTPGSEPTRRGAMKASLSTDADSLEPSIVVGWAKVDREGKLTGARNIVANVRHAVGDYEDVFKQPSLQQCAYHATLHGAGFVAVDDGAQPNSLKVETRNRYGVLADLAFHLVVVC